MKLSERTTKERGYSFIMRLGHDSLHKWADVVICARVARQIRVIRKSRGMTNAELAKQSGLSIMTVHRLQKWNGSGVRHAAIKSLGKLAAAFDCAFIIRFCSWGEWVEWIITPVSSVVRFTDDKSFHGGGHGASV